MPEAPGDGVEVGADGQELGWRSSAGAPSDAPIEGFHVPGHIGLVTPPSPLCLRRWVRYGADRPRNLPEDGIRQRVRPVSAIGLLRIMPAQARLPRAMSVSDEVMPIRKDVMVLEPWWQRLHRNRLGLERIKRGPLAS